jgi:hypothetical protein
MVITATPFEPKQKEISDSIHLEYRDLLYTSLFGMMREGKIIYDAPPDDFRDAADRHIACDCILDVPFKGLRHAMRFLVSYRFREDRYQDFQDITFTEYNHASDLPSELYKMAVHYFTYGYYDLAHRLIEAIIIDVPDTKRAIISGRLQPKDKDVPNTRSNQTFVSYSFDDLKRLGLMHRHFREVNGVLVPEHGGRQYEHRA